MTDPMSTKLRALLFENFSEDELISLCSEIGLNYAELPGAGAFGKSREMVAAARGRNKLFTLTARVRDLRPEPFEASGLAEWIARTPVNELPGAVGEAAPARSPRRADRGFDRLVRVLALAGGAVLVCLALGAAWIVFGGQPGMVGGIPTPAPQPAPTEAAPSVGAGAPSATTAAAPPVATARIDGPAATPSPPSSADLAPAAQAVMSINAQLVDFLEGRLSQDALRDSWAPTAIGEVLTFQRRLMPILGLPNPPPANSVNASVVYLQRPMVSSETTDRATVNSREQWTYANAQSGKAECETRDYTYTLAKEGAVYRIAGVDGRLISTSCRAE